MKVQELRRQIQELMRQLAINSLDRHRSAVTCNPLETERCNIARIAILQSIAYKQGQIIEILTQEIEYKEAA